MTKIWRLLVQGRPHFFECVPTHSVLAIPLQTSPCGFACVALWSLLGSFFVPKSLVHKKPPADVHRGEWKLPLTAAAPGTRVGGILLLDRIRNYSLRGIEQIKDEPVQVHKD